MKKEICPKVKVIMNNAIKEAKSFDDVKVRPEHILLSILMDDNNNCVDILRNMKIDTIDLYDNITEFIRKTDITPRIGNNNLNNNIRKIPPLSDETKTMIKTLDKECEKLKDEIIEPKHIMLGILLIKSPISDLLGNRGIKYTTYKKAMSGEITNKLFDSNSDETNENDSFKHKPKPIETTKGKTPVLDNFCRDITKSVENGNIDPVIGRGKEIKRISQILSRRVKNNCIIVGIPGSGKTSIVEGLTQLIKEGKASRTLLGKRIFSLDLASVVAGTKYRGQFEERMKAILEECKANPDVILFIDEIHTIIGAGNASGSLDASNIFKPALARGEIQVIGATTLDEYRENIEKDGALTRRFQQVIIEETTLDETKTILMNIKAKYENYHKVKYTEEAINECVKLADRYIMDRAMPDKAIDILDEAGASTNVDINKPDNIKKLEEQKEVINQQKKDVVKSQKYEEAAKLRDEERKINKSLIAATEDWATTLDKTITQVGPELIREIVSNMTGIPLTKISTNEGLRLIEMEKDLKGKIIGQDDAVSKIVKAIKRNRIGLKDKNKPLGVYMLLGNSGSGKTLLAKLLAEHMFGDKEALVRVDMSEYMEKHNVSRLIGSAPGYIGYEQGGQLTEKIRRKPHCVILFDEAEKAHEDVFNLLLQLMDEGHLTDGLGRKINFKNTLIIMTSNIGVKELSTFGKSVGFETSNTIANNEFRGKDIIEKALKKHFRPEFLNRVDQIITFDKLNKEDINKIIYLEVGKLESRLSEMNFKFKITEGAISFLAKEGYNEEYGARPLARAIQEYVEDPIADEILNNKISEGDIINIGFNKEKNQITISGSKGTKQSKK